MLFRKFSVARQQISLSEAANPGKKEPSESPAAISSFDYS